MEEENLKFLIHVEHLFARWASHVDLFKRQHVDLSVFVLKDFLELQVSLISACLVFVNQV
jgi:hypothetical protein